MLGKIKRKEDRNKSRRGRSCIDKNFFKCNNFSFLPSLSVKPTSTTKMWMFLMLKEGYKRNISMTFFEASSFQYWFLWLNITVTDTTLTFAESDGETNSGIIQVYANRMPPQEESVRWIWHTPEYCWHLGISIIWKNSEASRKNVRKMCPREILVWKTYITFSILLN